MIGSSYSKMDEEQGIVNLEMVNEGAAGHFYSKERLQNSEVKQLLNDLVADSTLHGLHSCFDSKHVARRVCWALIVLVAIVLLAISMHGITMAYFSYPFTTTINLHRVKDMVFPAVSLCNLNDLRLSAMNGTKLHELLTNPMSMYDIDIEDYSNTTKRASHKIKDMLHKCRFGFKDCSHKDFKHFLRESGSSCYTFNSGRDGKELIRVKRGGNRQQLSFTLNIEHHEYYPDQEQAGIRLILHGQDEIFSKVNGILLSTGSLTHIDVKKRKMKLLPKPYGTDCGDLKLKYYKKYTTDHCWLEKLTDHVLQKCGCVDAFMPGSHRKCSLAENTKCLWAEWGRFERDQNYSCPLQCEKEIFTPVTSSALFPTNKLADRMAEQLKINGSQTEKRAWIRDNFLKVDITFDEMSYESVEEVPVYNAVQVLACIGGLCAIFLGASFLTAIEFIEFFVMVVYTQSKRCFKK